MSIQYLHQCCSNHLSNDKQQVAENIFIAKIGYGNTEEWVGRVVLLKPEYGWAVVVAQWGQSGHF